MKYLIVHSFSIFLYCLEILLFVQIFMNMLPFPTLRRIVETIVEPLLRPIRFLLKHSVFQSGGTDSSPIIAFIVLSYLGQFLTSI